jgi:hypothetical protein
MRAIQQTQRIVFKWVMAGGASLVLALAAGAQVQSNTKVEHGAPTQSVNVERGEVVAVSGNNLIVRRDDGELLDFPNVPDNKTVSVDGKQLTIHDLKPGMKLERTTVVTTTPRLVTTVKTVTGKVWHVTPPNSVILTLQDGTNQSFNIPKGQKFTVNGRETDAFGLKKGMVVNATAVTESPESVVSHEVKLTGTPPPPPPVAPQNGVTLLIIVMHSVPAPVESAAAEPAPQTLPKTASSFPLIGLLGAVLCSLALGLKARRALEMKKEG